MTLRDLAVVLAAGVVVGVGQRVGWDLVLLVRDHQAEATFRRLIRPLLYQ